ncbi:MAG: glycosyltransferase family 2 protein [Gemmatimonadetes bacterium]|nr:glycosyltransferase family 2 protein [Gemmatimonadota bacterium]
MGEAFWTVIWTFNYIVLCYFIVLHVVYLGTSLFAFRALRAYALRLKSLDLTDLVTTAWAPPITLIAPAYNEETTCVESVRSLLTLEYPDYEILVVNDGSQDATIERLTEAFNLYEASRVATAELGSEAVRRIFRSRRHHNLWVIDKENGGKADALNAGLNHCQTPLFCAMDADSLLEPEALIRIVRPFLEDADTIAAGGVLRIANGCTVRQGRVVEVALPQKLLPRLQVLEYLRAFLAGRMGWDALDATLVISGAFGIFNRGIVVAAGGYSTDTVGEDMELVVRMHRYCRENDIPYRIHFVPDPVAWTECPESASVLARQRDRWQRGLFQSLLRHRKMLLNPRYGRAGMVAYPYFFFLEMLGPIIEFLGYFAFIVTVVAGRADWPFVIAFLGVAIGLGVALSLAAVALEELSFRRYPKMSDLLSLFTLSLIENFGYRQLSAWWRLKGTFSAIRGKEGWGQMVRTGFKVEAEEGAS